MSEHTCGKELCRIITCMKAFLDHFKSTTPAVENGWLTVIKLAQCIYCMTVVSYVEHLLLRFITIKIQGILCDNVHI